MVNLWHKYKNASKRKKQALHSLFVGFALFCLFYVITKFIPFPLCIIKNLFGISCPGCGLTRGFISILKLDFKAATQYNVLSIPLFIGIVIYGLLCVSDILRNRNDVERIEEQCKKKYMLAVFLIIFGISIYLNDIL